MAINTINTATDSHEVANFIDRTISQLDKNFDPRTHPNNVLHKVRKEAEKQVIQSAYYFFEKNISKTAIWLGLNRATLAKRMYEYGLDRE